MVSRKGTILWGVKNGKSKKVGRTQLQFIQYGFDLYSGGNILKLQLKLKKSVTFESDLENQVVDSWKS